ncbi:MAG TPA: hypothetical protein VI299_25095 [Polyangiales bacterium]
MSGQRTPFQRLRGASARSKPGHEVRFWSAILVALAVVIHGWYAPSFEARVGVPLLPSDASLHPAQLLERIAAYGAAGRRAYVAYLSLACLLSVAGSLLLQRLYEAMVDPRERSVSASRRLTLLAALPALCDLVENTLQALLATLYPSAAVALAWVAYVVTMLELGSVAVALLALAALAAGWLRRRVQARSRARARYWEPPEPHQTLP